MEIAGAIMLLIGPKGEICSARPPDPPRPVQFKNGPHRLNDNLGS